MHRPDHDFQSLRSYRRTFGLYALLLLGITTSVFWFLPYLSSLLSSPIQALLGAVLVTVLCVPLLWYGIWRRQGLTLQKRLLAERIVRQAADGILTINKYGQVLSLNPAAEKFFGYQAGEVINESITKLIAEQSHERLNVLHDTLPVGTILGLAAGAREVIGKRKNGELFSLELTGSSMTWGDDETISIALARDISKRKRAQRYLMAHYAATCILAEARTLAEVLPRLLQTICEALCWEAGAYWRFDAEAGVLCCAELHQNPLVARPDLVNAEPLTCPPEQGLVGRVWSTGATAWVEDVLGTQDCPSLAGPLQLHGAFAFPILLGPEVCGAMTFFSARPQKRDDQLLDIMAELGKQLGQFIAQKRDEEMLQRSEERFRQLAENIHEVFWMANTLDDRILYISPSCEEVWGRSGLDLPKHKQSFLSLVQADDWPRVLASWEKQQRGENTSEEYRVIHPDGSVRWVWDRAFPIRDGLGEIYRLAGITADITERKRTEEVLRETTQTLQALVEAAPVAISIVDLEGKVRLWNPAAERILGWTAAEILGQRLPALQVSGADLAATSHHGTRSRRKDKTLIDVSLSAAPLLDPHGATLGTLNVMLDLTEQKRLENQLRQAQKMEAVGQLAGGVAHDFNNLLTVITGYSEMLLEMHPAGAPGRDYLEQIKKSGDRAAALTRQLLAFGRKQILQVRVLDLNAVVFDMGKILRRLIGEDIEVAFALDPHLGRVMADPGQIEQILMNLAANSRDAMPQGGTLTITTANGKPDKPATGLPAELAAGSYVMLAISDTGCGMDEATKAHIFEPFFTTKEIGKGTGLGLATVYGIVQQSNGHIEVDSELGRGATFRIYLPCMREADPEGRDHGSLPDLPRGKETVLLVEDEDSVRKLVNHALQLSGYTVLEARSGEEALTFCKEHPGAIDLLVTDVIMPRMNGRQVAQRAVSLHKNLKVLYVSGYTDRVLGHDGILAPGTAFLPKPITLGALARKVRDVLDAPVSQDPGASRGSAAEIQVG